jgi:transposase-like protein
VSTRSRRRFTPEFKAEAVQMVHDSGGNIAQVAKELGVYDSTLGNWVRQARAEANGAPTAEE